MEKLADGLQKLGEDDLLHVVQMIHDHKSPETYTKNDVESEFISPFLNSGIPPRAIHESGAAISQAPALTATAVEPSTGKKRKIAATDVESTTPLSKGGRKPKKLKMTPSKRTGLQQQPLSMNAAKAILSRSQPGRVSMNKHKCERKLKATTGPLYTYNSNADPLIDICFCQASPPYTTSTYTSVPFRVPHSK